MSVAELLVEKGADVDARNKVRPTLPPTHIAAASLFSRCCPFHTPSLSPFHTGSLLPLLVFPPSRDPRSMLHRLFGCLNSHRISPALPSSLPSLPSNPLSCDSVSLCTLILLTGHTGSIIIYTGSQQTVSQSLTLSLSLPAGPLLLPFLLIIMASSFVLCVPCLRRTRTHPSTRPQREAICL